MEKTTTIFEIILRQLENGKIINKGNNNIIKRYLTRKHWLFYSVESKLVLISKYNKTIDKVFRRNKY